MISVGIARYHRAMSRLNLSELAARLDEMNSRPDVENEDRETLIEAARALVWANREIEFLSGQAKASRAGMDLVVRRLSAVTMCLWPGPIEGSDGRMMDGTPEMKIKCHDMAREAAKGRVAHDDIALA